MLPQGFFIERIQQLDAITEQHLSQLSKEFWEHHSESEMGETLIPFIKPRLQDANMLIAILFYQTEPVGYILAFNIQEHPFMPDWTLCGYVTNLYIRLNYRRQGLAETLFDYVEKWLKSLNTHQVMLNIDLKNPTAELFWREMGFTPLLLRMHKQINLTTNLEENYA